MCRVVFDEAISSIINIKRGLRQGCPLSPLLFILFLEPILKWATHSTAGYSMGKGQFKVRIPYTAFADDVALYTTNKTEMNNIIKKLEEFMHTYTMNFSFEKSIATGSMGIEDRPTM